MKYPNHIDIKANQSLKVFTNLESKAGNMWKDEKFKEEWSYQNTRLNSIQATQINILKLNSKFRNRWKEDTNKTYKFSTSINFSYRKNWYLSRLMKSSQTLRNQ